MRRRRVILGLGGLGVAILGGLSLFKFAKRDIKFLQKDHVTLENNIGNDTSSVLLLNTRTGAKCEEIAKPGSDTIEFGSLLSDAGLCRSDIVVFSGSNAMKLQKGRWEDKEGDEETVRLGGIVGVPVVAWVLYLEEGETFAAKKRQIESHFSLASMLFDTSLCGSTFGLVAVKNLTGVVHQLGQAAQAEVLEGECASSSKFMTLGYQSGALNVYYTMYPQALGKYCGPLPYCDDYLGGSDRIILVASVAECDTVAHELGHSMTLCHVKGGREDGMPPDNLMTERSNRGGLTEGQCFRGNLHAESMLNILFQGEVTRECPSVTKSSVCPSLAFDQVKNE